MDILVTSSLVAAFLAGAAALFAPCCITVLLPTYLASIFKEKRTVFFMTFIFFLGLLTIFLPLGLGFAGLSQLLDQYHRYIFGLGSLFLITLGIYTLLGKHFSLPLPWRSAAPPKIQSAGSVYVLGLFSGVGTICCAPVLAGALTLSILPGSMLWGGLYSMAYVLGMVIPLFIIAFFIDKTRATTKLKLFRKQIAYTLANRTVRLGLADAIAGLAFLAMGILTIYLAITDKLAQHSDYQMNINMFIADITEKVTKWLGQVPWFVVVGAVVLCTAFITVLAFRRKKLINNHKEEVST